MSDARVATVRIPTPRLRAAVEAAMETYRRERWAKIDAAVQEEMSIPAPTGWWSRRFGKRPAATREEAIERLKVEPHGPPYWSRWDQVWLDRGGEWGKLSALKDACDLGLDHVEVAAEHVLVFKAHYAPVEGYR